MGGDTQRVSVAYEIGHAKAGMLRLTQFVIILDFIAEILAGN